MSSKTQKALKQYLKGAIGAYNLQPRILYPVIFQILWQSKDI